MSLLQSTIVMKENLPGIAYDRRECKHYFFPKVPKFKFLNFDFPYKAVVSPNQMIIYFVDKIHSTYLNKIVITYS